jgi:hypothetical protein
MSFFHKKMSQTLWATIMPFGPVTLNILLAQEIFSGTEESMGNSHKNLLVWNQLLNWNQTLIK